MDKTFRRPWLAYLVSAGVRSLNPLWTLRRSLFQPVQHFIQLCQQKNEHHIPNTRLLNPKAENTNYSSKETATEPSPPRKRSDTRTPSDDQWHESQWQRDRSRTDLQTNENGKNLEPTWNNTSKFLI